MIVPLRRGTIRYAVVAELADAHGSGPCGRPWGFESLRPHQNKKTSIWMSFCFHTKTGGIRTREGMSVIRMSGEHSNKEGIRLQAIKKTSPKIGLIF